jgi:hypothetical protein
MCISIIQKSKNKKYSYFVAINREESYSKKWLEIDYHWQQYPDCRGYFDIDSGGTWLAHNSRVLSFLINKEPLSKDTLNTRTFIVLESLQSSNSAKLKILVLFLTEEAQESEVVKFEIETALDEGKEIIAFQAEEFKVKTSFGLLINGKHNILAFNNIHENPVGELIKKIQNYLNQK